MRLPLIPCSSRLCCLWLLPLVLGLAGCSSVAKSPRPGDAPKALTEVDFFSNATPAWNAWLDEEVTFEVKERPLWLLLSEHPAFNTGSFAIRSRRAYDLPITLRAHDDTRRDILLKLAREHRLLIALLPQRDPQRLEIISR